MLAGPQPPQWPAWQKPRVLVSAELVKERASLCVCVGGRSSHQSGSPRKGAARMARAHPSTRPQAHSPAGQASAASGCCPHHLRHCGGREGHSGPAHAVQGSAQSPPSTSGFFKPLPSWLRERKGEILSGNQLETKRPALYSCGSGSLSPAGILGPSSYRRLSPWAHEQGLTAFQGHLSRGIGHKPGPSQASDQGPAHSGSLSDLPTPPPASRSFLGKPGPLGQTLAPSVQSKRLALQVAEWC